MVGTELLVWSRMSNASTPRSHISDEVDDDAHESVRFESPRREKGQNFSLADVTMMPILERKMMSLLNSKDPRHESQATLISQDSVGRSEERRQMRWTMCLEELMATEVKYINDLKLIKTIFVQPLQIAADNNRPIVDQKKLQTIFADIDVFLKLHEDQFLPTLQRENLSGGKDIGKFFLSVASFLKIYTSYINKFEDIQLIIEKEKNENANFKEYVLRRQELPECDKLKLSDFLIKPLHRLTRYVLLLKELERNSPPDQAKEKIELQRAIAKVSEVTSIVNDRLRDAEHRRKVVSISEELNNSLPDLIQPYRRFFAEATFSLVTEGKTTNDAKVYVFNDLVLVAIKVREFFSGTFKIHRFDMDSSIVMLDVPDSPADQHTFRLFDKESNGITLGSKDLLTKTDLARVLVTSGLILEGVPYPPNRSQITMYARINVVVVGERESGKTTLLKTLLSSRRDTYSIVSEKQLPPERMLTFATETVDSFTIPMAINGWPHNVTVTDSFVDERNVPDHLTANRTLWKQADVVLFILNTKIDSKVEYWRKEISSGTFQKTPVEVAIVNLVDSPGQTKVDSPGQTKADPAVVHAAQQLGAQLQLSCAASVQGSAIQSLRAVASLSARSGDTRKGGISIFGMQLPGT